MREMFIPQDDMGADLCGIGGVDLLELDRVKLFVFLESINTV